MRNAFLSTVVAAVSASLVALPLVACGGSTSSGSGPSDSSFCASLKTFLGACAGANAEQACDQAEAEAVTNDCSAYAAVFSESFKTGVTTCAPAACGNDNDPFASPCFEALETSSSLTGAQVKLANDYCASPCLALDGETASQCVANFYGTDVDGGLPPGPGAVALQYSDAIIEKIDALCTTSLDGGANTCGAFDDCESQVLQQSFPPEPSACTSTSTSSGSSSGG